MWLHGMRGVFDHGVSFRQRFRSNGAERGEPAYQARKKGIRGNYGTYCWRGFAKDKRIGKLD